MKIEGKARHESHHEESADISDSADVESKGEGGWSSHSFIHSLTYSFIHYQIHSKYSPQVRHHLFLGGNVGFTGHANERNDNFFYTDRNGLVEEEFWQRKSKKK